MQLLTLLLLAILPQEGARRPADVAPPAPPEPAKQELLAACEALGKVDGYAFRQTMTVVGIADRSRGDDGAATPTSPLPRTTTVHGHVQKGLPLHLRTGRIEAWRAGTVLVHREGEGAWSRLLTTPAWIERTAREPGKKPRLLRTLSEVGPAHRTLRVLIEGATDLDRRVDGERVVYAGVLAPDRAADFAPGGTTDVPLQVVLREDGTLKSAFVGARHDAARGAGAVERKPARSLEIVFSDVGETEIALPEEVRSLLESARDEGADDGDDAQS